MSVSSRLIASPQVHVFHSFVLLDRLGRAIADDPALVKHCHLIGDAENDVHIVLGQGACGLAARRFD
jgi:hypothetical protein